MLEEHFLLIHNHNFGADLYAVPLSDPVYKEYKYKIDYIHNKSCDSFSRKDSVLYEEQLWSSFCIIKTVLNGSDYLPMDFNERTYPEFDGAWIKYKVTKAGHIGKYIAFFIAFSTSE